MSPSLNIHEIWHVVEFMPNSCAPIDHNCALFRNRMKFSGYVRYIWRNWFLPGGTKKKPPNGYFQPILRICGQTPHKLKIRFFRIILMPRKTDQENGMVYYVCMFGSWDIVVWKSEKCAKTADSAQFFDFQITITQEPNMQT